MPIKKRKLTPPGDNPVGFFAAQRKALSEEAKAAKEAVREARREARKPPSVELVMRLIREENGLLSPVARRLGMARMTLEDYVRARPRVEAVLKECRETLLDQAEAKLTQMVEGGDYRAVAFVLTMLGKGRGYALPKGTALENNTNNTLVIESVNVVTVPPGKFVSAEEAGGVTIDAKPIGSVLN